MRFTEACLQGEYGEGVILHLLVLANVFGFAVGMFFYYKQIAGANPLFWIFIPDCPLYIALATLYYLKFFKSELLRAITAIGLAKYGIWTVFALFYYSDYFLADWFGWLLVVEHIGMALQFALLAKPFGKKTMYAATCWFLLSDFVDYALGFHPVLPSGNLGDIAAFSLASSLIIPAFAYFYCRKIEKMQVIGAARGLLGI